MCKCNNRVQRYVDGIGKIHYLGNMIRFDFVTLDHDDQKGSEPTTDLVQRVIMTPQAFLNMFSSMQNLVDQLVKNGVMSTEQNKK